jgi:hypothetical protein
MALPSCSFQLQIVIAAPNIVSTTFYLLENDGNVIPKVAAIETAQMLRYA